MNKHGMLYDITVACANNKKMKQKQKIAYTFILIDMLMNEKQWSETKLNIHKRNISDIYVFGFMSRKLATENY